jgi:hypothetical protein
MNCDKAEKIIFLYVDNKLAKNKKQKFEKHISGCKNCRYELEASANIVEKYSELPDVEVSENVRDKIFENVVRLPLKPTFFLLNKLSLVIPGIRARFGLIPKFKPSIKFAFSTMLIFIFVLVGINHFRNNFQQKQDDLLEIFERTPLLERTYNLSLEKHDLNLDYNKGNRVNGVQKKIVNLIIKHEEFLSFSKYDIGINKIKTKINQMKNENLFRRNSS